jgi:hypothetical protein
MSIRSPRTPLAVLAVLVVVLLATSIPGIFTIDEDSYIATIVGLRNGSLELDATAGLTPSPELFSFDAAPLGRKAVATPVTTNLPPLYAVVALPFSWLGLRGLIALQTLSFAACAWLVFGFVRRETSRDDLAWFAMGAFVLASFSIEYAQGIWPHMLAVALVMLSIDCTSRLRAGSATPLRLAALAGFSAGLAAGVRYQDVVIAVVIAATLAWSERRARNIAVFVAACAIPLVASAAMNARRLGSWNPVSKGPTYLSMNAQRSTATRIEEAFTSTWARVVDFSTWPAAPSYAPDTAQLLPKQWRTGAFLTNGGLKKALLQSSPWAILPLGFCLAAWRRRRTSQVPRAQRELRMLALVVVAVVVSFSLFGFRHDGWCFNQRYFLELMPLLAVGMAIALAEHEVRWRRLAIGAVFGAAVGAGVCWLEPSAFLRQIFLLRVPMVLAGALAVCWGLARWSTWSHRTLVSTLLGAALGWATIVHLRDDLPAGRDMRERNRAALAAFCAVVPDQGPAALVTYWGNKDAFGPLLLERDMVIIDPWIDGGRDMRMLVAELQRQGRVVYVAVQMPRELLMSLLAGQQVNAVPGANWLLELRPGGAPAGHERARK